MKRFFLILFVVVVALSCSKSKYKGYKLSDNGLHYKIVEDKEGESVAVGDFINVRMQYKTLNDSVFFDSEQEIMPVWIPINKPAFKGDIMEGLAMLSIGDSASFIVRADTFFRMTIGTFTFPAFLQKDEMMYVNLRVLSVKTQSEFAQEKQIIEDEIKKQYDELKEKELLDLEYYLKLNNITQKPTETGLIFVPIKNGSGPRLVAGQTVKCHYIGTLIDGQIFDSSVGKAPLEVVVGSPDLIDGFNEALTMMSVGSQAKVIMPSSIAFGKSEIDSPIPPYATVVFEITIVSAN
jgi:FKBP-type peptidyl-prolyl cis-trans isomerase